MPVIGATKDWSVGGRACTVEADFHVGSAAAGGPDPSELLRLDIWDAEGDEVDYDAFIQSLYGAGVADTVEDTEQHVYDVMFQLATMGDRRC